MNQPTPGTLDLLNAITAFAEECRRAYRASLDQPIVPYVLHPADYELTERAVENGTAPDWLIAEFGSGHFIPAERYLPGEER